MQADEIISQVTAQACHQAGLSAVFRELLAFEGDEIYFTRVPDLDGHRYRDVQLAFEVATVLGWTTPDGGVTLNPDPDALFPPGCEVISVTEDDDTAIFAGFVESPTVEVDTGQPFEEPPQRVLMIGWSALGPDVLVELDQFLTAGSAIDLVVDPTLLGIPGPWSGPETMVPSVPVVVNSEVRVWPIEGGPEELIELSRHGYDQAIVLGYRGGLSTGESDARTMLTLLTLDKAWPERAAGPRVVAEMLDRASVAVAQTTGVDDFIVSDELSSLMMAQLSERLELHLVFDELFDAEGCFVSLHPAQFYAPSAPVTFACLVAAASERGETALGWRLAAGGAVVVNPPKSATVTLGLADQVLVLGPRSRRPAPT